MPVLMCRPDYFSVDYEINDWMSRENQPSKILSMIPWWRLFGIYNTFGYNVRLIEEVEGLPDMVFTANAGLVYKNKFIPSNFYHAERRGEREHFKNFFQESGYEIVNLPPDVFFEGQGDALWISENKLLLGYGRRTSEAAIEHLKAIMPDCEIIPIKMVHEPTAEKPKEFYHLDTVLCHLPMTNTFLVYPGALSPEAMETIRSLGETIEAAYPEAEKLVCNSVAIGKYILMPIGETSRFVELLNERGYKVFLIEMSEFLKAGGAVRCLSFFY